MMFLAKVTDISKVQLAPSHILVELVKRESNILLADSNGEISPQSVEFVEVKVVKSNSEKVEAGDLIIDTRSGAMTYSGYHEVGEKKYAIISEHDLKAWIKPDYYDKNKK